MPEPTEKKSGTRQRSSLARALGLAVVVSCFGAGAVLSGLAWQSSRVDCADLQPEECTFTRQTAAEIARLQWLAALGTLLVGAGALVWVRER